MKLNYNMKFILSTLAFFLIIFRFFLMYKILHWLFINYNNQNPVFSELFWVFSAAFLDIYLCIISREYEKHQN